MKIAILTLAMTEEGQDKTKRHQGKIKNSSAKTDGHSKRLDTEVCTMRHEDMRHEDKR